MSTSCAMSTMSGSIALTEARNLDSSDYKVFEKVTPYPKKNIPLNKNSNEIEPFEVGDWGNFEPKVTSWILEGIIPQGVALMLGGEMKSLKTMFVFDIAIAVATGGKFLNKFQANGKQIVLVYSPESGKDKIYRRLHQLCWGHGLNPKDVSPSIIIITPQDINLNDSTDLKRFKRTIEEYRPNLIILDPLINLHRGLDENSAEIKPLLDNIRSLLTCENMSLLLCHHLNKSHANHSAQHGLRGHGSIGGWNDGLITISKCGEAWDSLRRVSIDHKDEEGPEPFGFCLRKVQPNPQLEAPDDLLGMRLDLTKEVPNLRRSKSNPQSLEREQRLAKILEIVPSQQFISKKELIDKSLTCCSVSKRTIERDVTNLINDNKVICQGDNLISLPREKGSEGINA